VKFFRVYFLAWFCLQTPSALAMLPISTDNEALDTVVMLVASGVLSPQTEVKLTVDDDLIVRGEETTLRLTTENAGSCTSDGFDVTEENGELFAEVVVSPNDTTTYSVSCVNQRGKKEVAISVTVAVAWAELRANVDTVDEGNEVVFTLESANVVSCESSTLQTGGETNFTTSETPIIANSANPTVLYDVKCTGPAGIEVTDSVLVTVNPDPSLFDRQVTFTPAVPAEFASYPLLYCTIAFFDEGELYGVIDVAGCLPGVTQTVEFRDGQSYLTYGVYTVHVNTQGEIELNRFDSGSIGTLPPPPVFDVRKITLRDSLSGTELCGDTSALVPSGAVFDAVLANWNGLQWVTWPPRSFNCSGFICCVQVDQFLRDMIPAGNLAWTACNATDCLDYVLVKP
jgi:hypothetical protein